MNHEPLNTGSRELYGFAFGEAVLMSSPPSRSQICVGAKRQDFAESGFGGWADEKMKTVREAAPMLNPQRSPSTTFDAAAKSRRICIVDFEAGAKLRSC